MPPRAQPDASLSSASRSDRRIRVAFLFVLGFSFAVTGCAVLGDLSTGTRTEGVADAGEDVSTDVASDAEDATPDSGAADGAGDDGSFDADAADTVDGGGGEGNACGGTESLLLDGVPVSLGAPCGPCGDGFVVCAGVDAVRCAGVQPTNACGGCEPTDDAPGDSCGPCGDGVLACDGEGGFVCEGATSRNRCGGCALLPAVPGAACEDGSWACDGADALRCVSDGINACRGDEALLFGEEPALPGDPCEGACGSGTLVCNGFNGLRCAAEVLPNACGGCSSLRGTPGTSCGVCAGTWECAEDGESVVCADGAPNACGGCSALDAEPGDACAEGTLRCGGDGGLACVTTGGGMNACGGTAELDETPGEPCGTCDRGTVTCAGIDVTRCAGDPGEEARNACGGCAALATPPGATCGTCGSGVATCDGEDATTCDDDGGDDALNACGGCAELPAAPADACGVCAEYACTGTRLECLLDTESPSCDGEPIRCEELDCGRNRECIETDGTVDATCGDCGPGFVEEGDACVEPPDACGDGVISEGEVCDGEDLDEQTCVTQGFDGGQLHCAADCRSFDTRACVGDCPDDDFDSDDDGVVDSCDVCLGFDDRIDFDGDTVPDGCDECPVDRNDDSDGDGACDSEDACPDNPDLSADTNGCGGCETLPGAPGDDCGSCGELACDGTSALTCDDPGTNACGGCGSLPSAPGDDCGVCGTIICVGGASVSCWDRPPNECGGCSELEDDPGEECGDDGEYVCNSDGESVSCDEGSTVEVDTIWDFISEAGIAPSDVIFALDAAAYDGEQTWDDLSENENDFTLGEAPVAGEDDPTYRDGGITGVGGEYFVVGPNTFFDSDRFDLQDAVNSNGEIVILAFVRIIEPSASGKRTVVLLNQGGEDPCATNLTFSAEIERSASGSLTFAINHGTCSEAWSVRTDALVASDTFGPLGVAFVESGPLGVVFGQSGRPAPVIESTLDGSTTSHRPPITNFESLSRFATSAGPIGGNVRIGSFGGADADTSLGRFRIHAIAAWSSGAVTPGDLTTLDDGLSARIDAATP